MVRVKNCLMDQMWGEGKGMCVSVCVCMGIYVHAALCTSKLKQTRTLAAFELQRLEHNELTFKSLFYFGI